MFIYKVTRRYQGLCNEAVYWQSFYFSDTDLETSLPGLILHQELQEVPHGVKLSSDIVLGFRETHVVTVLFGLFMI